MFPPQLPGPGLVPGPAAAVPAQAGAPPAEEILNTMLELALVYRSVEKNPAHLLKAEKASTLLQQILADQAATAQRPGI